MFCTVTSTSLRESNQLSEEEYREKEILFNELSPKLVNYIKDQANRRNGKSPDSILDTDDYISLGLVQAWAAVIDFDPSKNVSLESWAKRRIWTNMTTMLSNTFHTKRIPQTEEEGKLVYRPLISIHIETPDGLLLEDHIEEDSINQLDILLQEEVYKTVRTRLEFIGDRVSLAVLRLSLDPDIELINLCGDWQKVTRVTNKALSERLGITDTKIAGSKKRIAIFIKMYETCSSCIKFKKCLSYAGKINKDVNIEECVIYQQLKLVKF
jgi:hypothetical protein